MRNAALGEPSDDGLDDRLSHPSVGRLLDLAGAGGGDRAFSTADALASEFGIPGRTLDFYRGMGLLAAEAGSEPPLYSRFGRTRLRTALLARMTGFSVAEAILIARAYD